MNIEVGQLAMIKYGMNAGRTVEVLEFSGEREFTNFDAMTIVVFKAWVVQVLDFTRPLNTPNEDGYMLELYSTIPELNLMPITETRENAEKRQEDSDGH